MALQLGLFESPKKLTEALASLTNIPTTIKIVDSSTGGHRQTTPMGKPDWC